MSSPFSRRASAALVDGNPSASVPPQTLDASFQFRDPYMSSILDLELFPDGTIAYGGPRGEILQSNGVTRVYHSIGRAGADGMSLNSGGSTLP